MSSSTQLDLFGASRPEEENLSKKEKLEALRASLVSCQACSLKESKLPGPYGQVLWRGNPDSGVLLLGEAPGKDEVEKGKPFNGEAGKVLKTLLEEELGIGLDDIYITNVVKCRPPSNRTPSQFEIVACSGRCLKEELFIVQPKLVIATGATAAGYILQQKNLKMKDIAGKAYPLEKSTAIILYHPAAILYERAKGTTEIIDATRKHLQLYKTMILGILNRK